MTSFDQDLRQRLDAIRQDGLYRELRRMDSAQGPRIQFNGRVLLNFSSNDYLGLANHPLLKQAAIEAVHRFGAGSGASRLICGSLAVHHELEEALAQFKRTEAAVAFSSGYAAALGAICAVVGKDNVIILDKLAHACIVDAARLSGARLRVFDHNDLNDLEDKLKWAASRAGASPGPARATIVTESVFSMDGDHAPLREIVELKERYDAYLMVDEAHATGLYGENRRGLAEELGVGDRIEIQMGTLGKALGAAGGFIAGSGALADLIINRARSFIFSTAPVPAAAAAARAAVQLVQSPLGADLRNALWTRVSQFRAASHAPSPPFKSAILPLILGDERVAVETAALLRDRGIFIPAIRYPTVARGKARLRVSFSAAHSPDDVRALVNALSGIRTTS